MNVSLTIIVAALNEEKNLEAAIEAIQKSYSPLGLPFEILLYDDQSADGTGRVADELARRYPQIRVFHNPRRLNIGGIYRAGIREAKHGYCLLLPGDNEVEVAEVAKGVRLLKSADIAVSYPENQRIRPFLRGVLSRVYTRIVNLLFGTRFAYTNGSNYIKTDLLRGIVIRTDGFAYQTETLVRLVRLGHDFAEWGVLLRARGHGSSTALKLGNWLKVMAALARLFWEVRVFPRRGTLRMGKRIFPPFIIGMLCRETVFSRWGAW